jgi:hypothetical protein
VCTSVGRATDKGRHEISKWHELIRKHFGTGIRNCILKVCNDKTLQAYGLQRIAEALSV